MPALNGTVVDERSAIPDPLDNAHRLRGSRSPRGFCTRFALMAALMLPASGCLSMPVEDSANAGDDSPVARLMSRFDTSWAKSTYMIATVQTPEELWNVYVVSIPPNQVAVRQSRQDGEYEFGLVDDLIWHVAFGRGQPTVVDREWAWFIRNHEIFRFSEWLDTLEFETPAAQAAAEDCSTIAAMDAFSLRVTLCIDVRGDPLWIERQTPPAYGDDPIRIEIVEWSEYEGRRVMKKYRQTQRGKVFEWEVQGLLDVPEDQQVLPPEGLETP